MRSNSKRDAAKEQFWRKAIVRFAASGLSKTEFCEQEGLTLDLLRYWTENINKRDEERRAAKPSIPKAGANTFLPITVTESRLSDNKNIPN